MVQKKRNCIRKCRSCHRQALLVTHKVRKWHTLETKESHTIAAEFTVRQVNKFIRRMESFLKWPL